MEEACSLSPWLDQHLALQSTLVASERLYLSLNSPAHAPCQVSGTKAGEGIQRSTAYKELNYGFSGVDYEQANTITSVEQDKEWQTTKKAIAKTIAAQNLR